MRGHDLPRLAESFRAALLKSGDLWFAVEVLLSEYDADIKVADARAAGGHARNPLPRRVSMRPFHVARQYKPIVVAVAERRGLALADMLGPRKQDALVEARQEAMWRIRYARRPAIEWSVVAAAVGRSHWTTAISGVRHFEERLAAEPELRARVGFATAEAGSSCSEAKRTAAPTSSGDVTPAGRGARAGGRSASPAKLPFPGHDLETKGSAA